MYEYNAKITSVYDGDTCTAEVDLGFEIKFKIKVRFYGIDTAELRSRDPKEKVSAYEARDYVRSRILDKNVVIRTYKDKKGKYGRYLGEILVINEANDLISLNQELIKLGYAKIYEE